MHRFNTESEHTQDHGLLLRLLLDLVELPLLSGTSSFFIVLPLFYAFGDYENGIKIYIHSFPTVVKGKAQNGKKKNFKKDGGRERRSKGRCG